MTAPANNINKQRIAKNTLYLYIRMLLLMGVNFYAIRVLLNTLGVDDYGIFNLIFGFVIVFMPLNNALTGMVHRFLCYEMGKGNSRNVRIVFSISLLFFAAAAILSVILSETIGLWFVHNKLNIPSSRMSAALSTYQFAVVTIVIRTIQIPYMATITAFEKMKYFAKVSIIESSGLLAAVLLLKIIPGDHLLTYSYLYTLSVAVTAGCYIGYCHFSFPECRLTRNFSMTRIGAMGSFFSWGTFGAVANLFRDQGVSVLLNIFCGVAANATMGLANKLGSAVLQLVTNFQMAMNPQIVKAYGAKDDKGFFDLIISSTRYSFILIWIFALPLLVQTEFFLKLWLGDKLPADLIVFVQMTILSAVINAINGPLWTAGQANGKIKKYHIQLSILLFLTFVLSWIALLCGGAASCVPVIVFGINVASWVYRVLYLKYVYKFALRLYCSKAFAKLSLIVLTTFPVAYLLKNVFPTTFSGNFLLAIICFVINAGATFAVGLTGPERGHCIQKVKSVLGYGN